MLPPASLNLSWPRFKCSPFAFAVMRPDQAIAVFVNFKHYSFVIRKVLDTNSSTRVTNIKPHYILIMWPLQIDITTLRISTYTYNGVPI
jgi:hypothetical protein